jgi:hypothetical protein
VGYSFAEENYVPNLIPRPVTWEVLQKTRNQAAIEVLARGLASGNGELRRLCLSSLLMHPQSSAREEILAAWESYSEDELKSIQTQANQFKSAVATVLRDGRLSHKRSALLAIPILGLTDSLAAVLDIVVDAHHALQAEACTCMQTLCKEWGERARSGRDVPSVRTPMLETMYGYLQKFSVHRCVQVVDAWLALVTWDDSLQRGLISDPGNAAFRPVLSRFQDSREPGVLQLLAGYASRSTTPRSVLTLLTERPDAALAIELVKLADADHFPPLRRRLQELNPLACLQSVEQMELADFEQLKRMWLMVAASTNDFGLVLRGALRMARIGTAEGRQVAAEILSHCRRPKLEVLVDELQSTLGGISKPNSFGPALMEIALWATSHSVVLQQAAADCFSDFKVQCLVENIRFWPTSMCKAMAQIVALLDKNITEFLVRELESPSPKRRIAALQATQLLDVCDAVRENVTPLLDDPRLEVRVRAIDILSALGSPVLESRLIKLLDDASTDIQDAAQRAIQRRGRMDVSQALALGEGE